MAMQIAPSGSRYGVLPGSDTVGQELYGPQYRGMMGLIAPADPRQNYQGLADSMAYEQQGLANQQQQKEWGQHNQIYKQLMDSIGGNGGGNYNFQSWGQPVPSPNWASTSGIWSRGQIDQQANLQRSQLYANAANQSRNYANQAAARGFSPMSPLTSFMENMNMNAANQAAAANTTNLNWTAAQGNREAQQRGESINAGLYGSWTDALARQRSMQMQAQQQAFNQRYQQQQLLAGLLGRV